MTNTGEMTLTSNVRTVGDGIERWLCSGATQAGSGAYCGWRDAISGELSPEYPEITGYAVGFLSGYGHAGTSTVRSAAEWLIRRWTSGDRSARPEKTGPAVYTFDIAMQAHGLIRFGLATGDEQALATGGNAVTYLIEQIDRYGRLPAVVPDTARESLPPTWSTAGHLHLLKTVQALLSGEEIGVPGAARAAGDLVAGGLRDLEGAAALPATCPGSDIVSLHALSYAAEGLWVYARRRGDAAALHRSADLTRAVWTHRLPAGGFPAFVREWQGPTAEQRQSDVSAQAVRLAVLHGIGGPEVAAETARIVADAWQDGGQAAVYYHPGTENRHLNSWASMFAAQALTLAGGGLTAYEWRDLV